MSTKSKLMIIGITILAIVTIGTTLSGWVVNEKQSTFNTITAGCIDISFVNGTGTLSLEKTIPITDAAGMAMPGYSFTLKNNCNSEVSYFINLDLFNVANSTNLSTDEVKLAIDGYAERAVSKYPTTTKNDSNASTAYTLASGVLAAKSSETHNVKMWVDENSTTQNAVFSSRLFTASGPNLTVNKVTADNCFIIDDTDGQIIFYKSFMCPKDVVIPNQINGVTVRGISNYAFIDTNMIINTDDSDKLVVIILDEEHYDYLAQWATDMNDQWIESANIEIHKASEFTNWNMLKTNNYKTNIAKDISYGNSYLNIPLDMSCADVLDTLGDISYLAPDSNNRELLFNPKKVGYNSPKYNLQSWITSVDMSRATSLTTIGGYAFLSNWDLSKVEFPSSLTTINASAFMNDYLGEVYFPLSLTTLGSQAFLYNHISELEFNTPVTINGDVIFGANNLTKLIVNATLTPAQNVRLTDFNDNNNLTAQNIIIGYNSTNTAVDFLGN